MYDEKLYPDFEYIEREIASLCRSSKLSRHFISYKKRIDEYRSLMEHIDYKGFEICLDVGCGSGIFTLLASYSAKKSIGIDSSLENSTTHSIGLGDAEYLKKHFRRDNMNIAGGCAEQIPLSDSSCDILFSHFVFEHITDKEKALNELGRVLKDTGKAYVSVPNLRNRINWLFKYLFSIDVLKNYLRPLYRLLCGRSPAYAVKDSFVFIPPHDSRYSFMEECLMYRKKTWDKLFSGWNYKLLRIRKDSYTYVLNK